jgi:hypothetical protein
MLAPKNNQPIFHTRWPFSTVPPSKKANPIYLYRPIMGRNAIGTRLPNTKGE